MTEPTAISTAMLAKHGAVAIFGALVHAARAHRMGASKGPLDFLLLCLMSSFSGMIFSFMALHIFGENQLYMTLSMAGVGGFLGVEGMSIIIDKMRQMITTK